MWNFQKKQMMYLEMSFEYSEQMTKSWSEFEKYWTPENDPENISMIEAGPQQMVVDGVPASKEEDAEKKKLKREAGPEVETSEKKKARKDDVDVVVGKEKDEAAKKAEAAKKTTDQRQEVVKKTHTDPPMAEALKAALKYKAAYTKGTSETTLLLRQIESDDEWAWASNEQNKGKLEKMMKKIDDSHGLAIIKRFLTEDVAAIKKKHSREEILDGLKKLVTPDRLANLTNLEKTLKTIKLRHVV